MDRHKKIPIDVVDFVSAYKLYLDQLLSVNSRAIPGPNSSAKGMFYYNNFANNNFDTELIS